MNKNLILCLFVLLLQVILSQSISQQLISQDLQQKQSESENQQIISQVKNVVNDGEQEEEEQKQDDDDDDDDDDDEDKCKVFGQRVFLGEYFSQKQSESNMYTVAGNTYSGCGKLFMIYQIGDKKVKKITPIKSKNIDTKEFTGGKKDYQVSTSFFYIPYKEAMREVKTIKYAVYLQKDEKEEHDVFEIKLPEFKENDGEDGENIVDNILVYGDYDANVQENKIDKIEGMGQHTHNYIKKQVINVETCPYDMQLFLGDLAYDIQDENYQRGEKYFRKTTEYNAHLPYIGTYGNHDSGDKEANFGYQFMDNYFYMPNHVKGQNRDYHFSLNNAQFVNLQMSYTWYDKPEEKEISEKTIQKFKEQLEQAQKFRKQKPWLIVFTHFPIYYTLESNQDEKFQPKLELFKEIEEIMKENQVDLYLSAHVHAYQRFKPLYQGKECKYSKQKNNGVEYYVTPECPYYVVEGLGGQATPIQTIEYENQKIMENQDFGQAGVGRLTIHSPTHLQYQHIRTETGEVVDEFWIVKGEKHEPKTLGGMVIFGILLSAVVIALLCLYMLWKWRKQAKTEQQNEGQEKSTDLESSKKEDLQQELVQQDGQEN